VTREVGCAIIGQTADLAPADKRLYAIRDVTATVESVDLITASILSKKLAAGLQGLVMDVKFGSGAFMSNAGDARALAESLVLVANGAGLPTSALLTDMNEPLASAAGNSVEMAYVVDYLTGRRRETRFHEVTVALAGEMLALGGLALDPVDGARRIKAAIESGRACETFSAMVTALGGPSDFVSGIDRYLPKAPVIRAVEAEGEGVVEAIATRDVGVAVVALGGGRTRPEDTIDHAVGLTDLARVGEAVGSGRPLGVVHARDEAGAEAAIRAVRAAYRLGAAPAQRPLVLERIGA
jgi:thymidine phosphorylase